MGFSVTWCAVREEAADQLLSHLRLSATGETEERPESHFSSAKLKTGWRLIWSSEYGCPTLMNGVSTFTGGHEVVACQIEEHVMASSAEAWVNGTRKWWLSHEGEGGPKGLETDGAPPESSAAIRQEMEDAQLAEGGDDADVDYIFEIPLRVARTLVGFKHDQNYERVVDGAFVVLSPTQNEKGFLSRLFGK